MYRGYLTRTYCALVYFPQIQRASNSKCPTQPSSLFSRDKVERRCAVPSLQSGQHQLQSLVRDSAMMGVSQTRFRRKTCEKKDRTCVSQPHGHYLIRSGRIQSSCWRKYRPSLFELSVRLCSTGSADRGPCFRPPPVLPRHLLTRPRPYYTIDGHIFPIISHDSRHTQRSSTSSSDWSYGAPVLETGLLSAECTAGGYMHPWSTWCSSFAHIHTFHHLGGRGQVRTSSLMAVSLISTEVVELSSSVSRPQLRDFSSFYRNHV